MADTGLDMNSCFFSDDTGNVAVTTQTAAAFDLTRRKVVQYVASTGGDSTDLARGHGTHVAGRWRKEGSGEGRKDWGGGVGYTDVDCMV